MPGRGSRLVDTLRGLSRELGRGGIPFGGRKAASGKEFSGRSEGDRAGAEK